jgi:xylulokinase/glycerol kinase
MKKFVLALDVGTTGTRSIIFDLKGKEIGRSYQEWESFYPSPVMVEQDADMWWESVRKTIFDVIKDTKIDRSDIISCAITNQRETIVPVDRDGKPLHRAIVWQDRRTIPECEWISKEIGPDKIYQKTGLTIDPYFSASKILWIKNNYPEIYKHTHKFLLVHDFILFKLSGIFATDYSNASRTMLFDIRNLKWSDEIGSAMGIDIDKMPDALPSGTDIGNVVSEDTGLSTKTKVIVGAGDQQSAALGVGVVKPGRIKCTTGTGSFILAHLDQPIFDTEKRVLCSCHAIPNKWVQEASIFTTGAVLRWARDTLGGAQKVRAYLDQLKGIETDPYDIMTELAASAPIGANGLITIPHFIGAGAPHWNPNARGVIFGAGLSTSTGDIYRSIMEGVAMEVRKNLNIFRKLDLNPSELRITGGGSRSDTWNQIMADVLGIQCGRGELEESTAVGAAILAGYGAGEFSDLGKASDEMANITRIWKPNPTNKTRYDKLFSLSEKIYSTLDKAGIYDLLGEYYK